MKWGESMKQLLVLCLLIGLLSGCNQQTYTPLSKGTIIVTTNQKDGSVSFIDARTHTLRTTWNMNKAIQGSVLLPDGDTIAFYGKQLSHVLLYSLAKGKQVGEWETGVGIVNIIVAPQGNKLALADQNTNTIRMYSPSGKEEARIPIGDNPLTFVQDEQHLYVVNFRDGKLSNIDWSTNKVISAVTVPVSSMGALLHGNELWLGGHGNGDVVNESIHIFNVQSGELLRSVPAPQMPVSFASDGMSIYVLSHGSDTVRKINGTTYAQEAQITVGSNPFALTLVGNELFIASYDSDEVVVVDSSTMTKLATISVGKGPFQFTVVKGEEK